MTQETISHLKRKLSNKNCTIKKQRKEKAVCRKKSMELKRCAMMLVPNFIRKKKQRSQHVQ